MAAAAPGITAAVGLLKTDLQYEHGEAGILVLDSASDADLARIGGHVEKLRRNVREETDADGIARDARTLKVITECRYQGQGLELRAEFPDGPLTQDSSTRISKGV